MYILYIFYVHTVFNILIYFNSFYVEQNQELIYVSLLDKNTSIQDEIDILKEDPSSLTVNAFKDQMVSTVVKLYEIIDFLKKELEEKNLLLRTLLLREANGISDLVDESLAENNTNPHIVETMSSSSSHVNISK